MELSEPANIYNLINFGTKGLTVHNALHRLPCQFSSLLKLLAYNRPAQSRHGLLSSCTADLSQLS